MGEKVALRFVLGSRKFGYNGMYTIPVLNIKVLSCKKNISNQVTKIKENMISLKCFIRWVEAQRHRYVNLTSLASINTKATTPTTTVQ